jgi:hypothetical protein
MLSYIHNTSGERNYLCPMKAILEYCPLHSYNAVVAVVVVVNYENM